MNKVWFNYFSMLKWMSRSWILERRSRSTWETVCSTQRDISTCAFPSTSICRGLIRPIRPSLPIQDSTSTWRSSLPNIPSWSKFLKKDKDQSVQKEPSEIPPITVISEPDEFPSHPNYAIDLSEARTSLSAAVWWCTRWPRSGWRRPSGPSCRRASTRPAKSSMAGEIQCLSWNSIVSRQSNLCIHPKFQ